MYLLTPICEQLTPSLIDVFTSLSHLNIEFLLNSDKYPLSYDTSRDDALAIRMRHFHDSVASFSPHLFAMIKTNSLSALVATVDVLMEITILGSRRDRRGNRRRSRESALVISSSYY